MNQYYLWASAHPWPAGAACVAALAVAGGTVSAARAVLRGWDRPPAAVVAAAIAAAGCTAYSADTSWRFAADHLGMTDTAERAALFAAGEAALFSTALMARQNLNTTGAPGVPGALVWVITGVQVIPAYAESGIVGGTVRAFIGPVLAALLWHLAMGIELRHAKPGAGSQSLPALVARELRERLLSRLGLAVRDRSAAQITRDRWTMRAVDLAARLSASHEGQRGYARTARRLSKAVGLAQVGAHPEQRRALLQLLSARLHSTALASLDLPSPWDMREPATPPRPATVIAYRELREMQPMDAVLAASRAHPALQPDELRALLGEHGVVVSATQVDIALRGRASAHPRALQRASAADQTLFAVHARIDDLLPPDADEVYPDAPDADEPDADADRALLPDARRLDDDHKARHGRTAPLRVLQRQLRIGQPRAQRMRALLDEETGP
ncbi:hypothetical protein [Streptomyces sp. NPDC051994]|uniref:hypothetical protein n=1 Tax=unclassified Streptomyces TaxID=2593676 RepID=UPI0034344E6E